MKNFSHELSYKTSRSSGAGGQNVNKVETAVTVMWEVAASTVFNDFEKELISTKLKNRINSDGVLQLTVSESRTQLQNKKIATDRILEIVNQATFIPKARHKTKPTKGSKERRIQAKKILGEKKENRKFRF